MILFKCYETNVVIEEIYEEIDAGFCIVENYEHVYREELLRFNKVPGVKPYGIPYEDNVQKAYLGIGNFSNENSIQDLNFYSESCLKPEHEVIEIKERLFSKKYCDVVWFKVYGSDAIAPDEYETCGYDITFTPNINGAFSIINDCMFICRWHGCDEEGTAFLDYFNMLNKNGLFDDINTALGYMKRYLSFDWSERGEYLICEVFRRK